MKVGLVGCRTLAVVGRLGGELALADTALIEVVIGLALFEPQLGEIAMFEIASTKFAWVETVTAEPASTEPASIEVALAVVALMEVVLVEPAAHLLVHCSQVPQ